MNGRTIAGIVLTLLLVGGAVAIGVTAYNAGVTQGLVDSGQVVVAPGYPVGPYVGGYGYNHGGFGFFGFLGTLVFIFLVIGLLRAVIGGRGGWGRSGWGGPGGRYGGPGGQYGAGPWSDRAREFHDELHRTSGQSAKDPTDQERA
jgi:hypothetical protein